MMTPIAQAKSLLKSIFGYDTFKPLQAEIIEHVLQKKDTLVIMPTGGGKSLCYQLPALIFEGLTVVVSPLISLMKDQVEQLSEAGVPAVFLNSSLSFEEYQENMERIQRGEVKLLYVAPEALLTPRLLGLLSSVRLDCLTIDEAHCISEWGHDFRPEYRQIVDVRQRFPSAVCVALTATATQRVRQDIKTNLRFSASSEFIASFNRENLYLEVTPKNDPTSQTVEFVRKFPSQSGIIYCFSRKQVDQLSADLAELGFSVRPYHAGLTDEERKTNQELFIHDDVQIIVATIAFGMGINKPNVRFVVHYDLPKSIESYYQEIGRAGRDGLPSHCLLLFSYADIQKLKYFITQKEEPERKIANQHLQALIRYAEEIGCRRVPLLGYFGETYTQDKCDMCDHCLSPQRAQVDVTIPAQKFLSCVKRTGETFGMLHIVDVLLGSENQKVLKFGHQELSTYGIGKEYSRSQWMSLGRQLVQQGFLEQDSQYGSLILTAKAYDLFRTREPVFAVMEDEQPADAKPGKDQRPDYDAGLFELLRTRRKQLADEGRVPPYVIFSDRTLMEMAAYLPTTPERMMKIFGIGSHKFERYGETFMSLIAGYADEHGLKAQPHLNGRRTAARGTNGKLRHIVVGDAFNGGETVEQLMQHFDVQQGTILEHLFKYVQEGHALRCGSLLDLPSLPPGQHERALQAFDRLGVDTLRPVYDELGGSVSWDDLRILRLHYLCQDNA